MKKKIIFFIPFLNYGGAERVTLLLASKLSAKKYNKYLMFLNNKENHKIEYGNFQIIDLKKLRLRSSIFKIVKEINSIKPDIIFSSIGYINIIIIICRYFTFHKYKIIIREANLPSISIKKNKNTKLFKFLYNFFYPKADKILVSSKIMKNDMIENFSINSRKIFLLNNPVDCNKILSKIDNKKNIKRKKIELVACGRLTYQKGFDRLIYWAQKFNISYNLQIIGDGEQRLILEKLIKEKNLESKIFLIGNKKEPYQDIFNADAFLLSSRWEGMPNVVLEAMVCGTKIIASKEIKQLKEFKILIDKNFLNIAKDQDDFINLVNNLKKIKYINKSNNLPSNFHINQVILIFEKIIEKL